VRAWFDGRFDYCHQLLQTGQCFQGQVPDRYPVISETQPTKSIGVTSLGLGYLSFLKMNSKFVPSVRSTFVSPRLSAIKKRRNIIRSIADCNYQNCLLLRFKLSSFWIPIFQKFDFQKMILWSLIFYYVTLNRPAFLSKAEKFAHQTGHGGAESYRLAMDKIGVGLSAPCIFPGRKYCWPTYLQSR
jgi:hypothetical protein